MHKGRPIVQPGKGQLEEVKSCTAKVSQCKGNRCIIISIWQIVMEIEIAKEKETGELIGVGTSKVSGSLAFALPFLLSWHLSSLVIKLMASARFRPSLLSKGISLGWLSSRSSIILWTELQVAGGMLVFEGKFQACNTVIVHLQMDQRYWQWSQRNAGTWEGMVDRREVWEYGESIGRQEDLALTYVLCPCPRIKVSLI